MVGEVDRAEVSLVSAQQDVVGRPGLPVPLSLLVANILDRTVGTANLGAPPASISAEWPGQPSGEASAALLQCGLAAVLWARLQQELDRFCRLDPSPSDCCLFNHFRLV